MRGQSAKGTVYIVNYFKSCAYNGFSMGKMLKAMFCLIREYMKIASLTVWNITSNVITLGYAIQLKGKEHG